MSKSTAIKLAPIIWEVGNIIFFWRYEVSESYESNQILTNFYYRVKIFLQLDFTQQNINNFESFRKLLNTLFYIWLVVYSKLHFLHFSRPHFADFFCTSNENFIIRVTLIFLRLYVEAYYGNTGCWIFMWGYK